MREHADELDASFAALQAAQLPTAPDAESLARMDALAEQVAAGVMGSIQFAPLELVPVAPEAFEAPWDQVLAPARAGLAGLGWRELGWAEWPAFRAALGHQAVSSIWVQPGAGTVAILGVVQGAPSIDLETEFEDGHFAVTALCRGRNFLVGPPELDMLFVEPRLALDEAVALHAARVRHVSALHPGRQPLRCNDLAGVAAMQERGRARKTAFRLAAGLTRSEALGVPHDYPEWFAPRLQEATRRGVAALRAGLGA